MKNQKTPSAKELFKHAFDTMVALKKKSISVDEAKAHAHLLKQSNNLLKYELDRAVAIAKYDGLKIRNIEGEETNNPAQ